MQSEAASFPVVLSHVPAAQSTQSVWLEESASNLPAAQSMHAADPAGANFPAPHATHAPDAPEGDADACPSEGDADACPSGH